MSEEKVSSETNPFAHVLLELVLQKALVDLSLAGRLSGAEPLPVFPTGEEQSAIAVVIVGRKLGYPQDLLFALSL